MITEIFHNASGEMEITANSPFLDALNGEGYFAKESKFDSTEADLLALEVSVRVEAVDVGSKEVWLQSERTVVALSGLPQSLLV